MTRRVCVCVPARNEAERIRTLVGALGAQTSAAPVMLALCVNNSSDDTLSAAIAAANGVAGKVDLKVVEHWFEPAIAHAGSARRAAMDLGSRVLDDDGVLISTDADCRPPPGWIAANLAAIDADDAIVGGRILIDEAEAVDPSVLAIRRRLDRYWEAVRAIEDAVDPVRWDPPPRHGDHTGASIALGVSLYRRAGGVPRLPSGEDRALVEAAIAVGGRLFHPPEVWTRTSARTDGRAALGMAADMRRWSEATPNVPAFSHWRARAEWRRTMRSTGQDHAIAARERTLPPMPDDMALPEF